MSFTPVTNIRLSYCFLFLFQSEHSSEVLMKELSKVIRLLLNIRRSMIRIFSQKVFIALTSSRFKSGFYIFFFFG